MNVDVLEEVVMNITLTGDEGVGGGVGGGSLKCSLRCYVECLCARVRFYVCFM